MKIKLIYPKWKKLARQTQFHLPPHGPVVFAACLPDDVDLQFTDENVDTIDFSDSPDIVALSIMLSAQLPRAYEIARLYRERGIPVIAGGIAATLHADELAAHVDSVFLGEAEGRMDRVLRDFKEGKLSRIYDYLRNPPNIELVGPGRRNILNYPRYQYRGLKMLDLVHASRGCRFDCFPCCTGYLGGKNFRPRPIDKVIEEIGTIDNNRFFLVDNSLSQNDDWELSLFKELIPLKVKWVSHPIKANDKKNEEKLLDLAYQAGCWYVYQAVFDTSDNIRNRIKSYKDHGIGVEGTIILGSDNQDVDYIKRLVDFLLEVELDTAEFTIMTPFMHTPIRHEMEKDGRILTNDWSMYTCDHVTFTPKNMSCDELLSMYDYAWDTFYREHSQEFKMGELFIKLVEREKRDGTFRKPRLTGNTNNTQSVNNG